MRICQVIHGYPPRSRGGVENYARALAERLAGSGHEVCVFYPLLDRKPAPELIEEVVNGVRLAGFCGGSRDFFGHVSEPATERAFADYLDRGRFDAVHFQHTYHGLPLSLAPLAAERAPLVAMTLHDFWHVCPRAHLFIEERGALCRGPESDAGCAACLAGMLGAGRDALAGLEGFMRRRREAAMRALSAVRVLTAPSRYVLGSHSRALGLNGRGEVRPLGLEPRPARPRIASENGVRFTFMGSVNRLKNLRVVLDAMRMTRGAAKLDVHGRRQDPREAARLERAARADVRIRYRGPYSEDDLPDILARTDVGLVPSLTESFSLVAREFLAAEIPVFAAGAGALPEAVGRGGALFDPDDAPGLAALMQGVIDESGQVERMRAGIAPVRGMADDAAWWERVYAGEDRA